MERGSGEIRLKWRTIPKPGGLTGFHPFCRSNPAHRWPGLEWFVILGTPVSRNQFEAHAKFSPPSEREIEDQR